MQSNIDKRIINIGILAHVDAGKTSITENMLFLSGESKKLGNVDSGTSHSDFLKVEQDRGISVKASINTFYWNNCQINLIDTPGHVDFSSELERSLAVLDYAILVLSAVEGLQSHSDVIWRALKENNIPCLLFLNKIDRVGADTKWLLQDIKKEWSKNIFEFQKIENEASEELKIRSEHNMDDLIDILSNYNEKLLEQYINEQAINTDEINKQLIYSLNHREIFPVLFGSAKYGLGIEELLDFVTKYFVNIDYLVNDEFSAQVFGIRFEKKLGKLVQVKILSGSLKNRELVKNQTRNIEEKVNRIRKFSADKWKDIDIAVAGDIVSLAGLSSAEIGNILGTKNVELKEQASLNIPLLTTRVKPVFDKDYTLLAEALFILSSEDPKLSFEWLKEENELHIRLMGAVQTEILEQVLENRFVVKAIFEKPTVIYKETPCAEGEGFVRYWMPKPCWAILKFKIEALPVGSGVQYNSQVSVNDVQRKYQNEVEQSIPIALKQGIKGWEVTDIKITLIEGEEHTVHSRPGDFKVATPMGIMNGLQNIGTCLLEPILAFKIKASDELLGSIAGDIHQMRGSFESPVFDGNIFIMHGLVPLSTSMDYAILLSSKSGGKAQFSTQFDSYQHCSDEHGVIRKFRGISPLDTAKYILKARKAIQ